MEEFLQFKQGSMTVFVTPRTGSAVARYCPLWAWLHSHQPARFCFWELTKQLPRVVTHPGIAPASNSFNFGVPTNPKPVSSQKASRYEDARVVTHPGIAPASNLLNFGVPTNPKPVSSQKASRYEDASFRWVVPVGGHLKGVVTVRDHPVAAVMEVFDLESVPVAAPISVVVLGVVL
ncbi:hypothetical protein L3X38_001809 [Prunus dulcis]|uniref:Uncharacterized protein n=1 Tax=Prunus dulcis TaxID=3755 RepID=A0AAD4ZJD3_PRUDU|nr:hypothetical protein L3X38_001809 [Prunus dulcis]